MKNCRLSKKKICTAVLSIGTMVLFFGALFFLVGRPMLEMVGDIEGFRAWIESRGIWGRILFVGFMVLQVIVSVIPSEPLEIGAGYAFGAIEGTVLCLLGIMLGTAAIFAFVRRFGKRVVEIFVSTDQLDELSFLRTERRLRAVTFLLYFIPGIPKDAVTWLLPLTRIRFLDFMFISSVARIFSIVTSTISGDALGEEKYTVALIVFAVTALVSVLGYFIWRFWNNRRQSNERGKSK